MFAKFRQIDVFKALYTEGMRGKAAQQLKRRRHGRNVAYELLWD